MLGWRVIIMIKVKSPEPRNARSMSAKSKFTLVKSFRLIYFHQQLLATANLQVRVLNRAVVNIDRAPGRKVSHDLLRKYDNKGYC